MNKQISICNLYFAYAFFGSARALHFSHLSEKKSKITITVVYGVLGSMLIYEVDPGVQYVITCRLVESCLLQFLSSM